MVFRTGEGIDQEQDNKGGYNDQYESGEGGMVGTILFRRLWNRSGVCGWLVRCVCGHGEFL